MTIQALQSMGRNKRGRPIHGWLVVDKDSGMTSAQAVSHTRRLLGARKAGHAGTLDPLATGVLPIALGEATKTVPYVMNGAKTYQFTICFGESRNTDDLDGAVLETSDIRPDDKMILEALPQFTGVLSQVPPLYSAIKINGQRSYKRARDGAVELPPPRSVEIRRFELLGRPNSDSAIFEVDCGKGTYIRSLARDLGKFLGTVAYVSKLRRIRCGPFCQKDAISLATLSKSVLCAPPQEVLLSIATALDDIPALAVTETQTGYLRHGRSVRVRSGGAIFVDANQLGAIQEGDVLFAMSGENPVALARLEGEEIRPMRVLNL